MPRANHFGWSGVGHAGLMSAAAPASACRTVLFGGAVLPGRYRFRGYACFRAFDRVGRRAAATAFSLGFGCFSRGACVNGHDRILRHEMSSVCSRRLCAQAITDENAFRFQGCHPGGKHKGSGHDPKRARPSRLCALSRFAGRAVARHWPAQD